MKFIDGTPVDQAYLDKVYKLVHGAAKATETCSENELEEYAANLNSAQTPKNDELIIERHLCVDGHEFPDSASNWAGDGKFPPFAVFDIDAQSNLQPYYLTRTQAENAMNEILAAGKTEKIDECNSESSLPRNKVAEILSANDEICNESKIGYYSSLKEIAEKVSGTKNWSIGEVFVHARSPDDFVIMKQIAPDSCEMLTMTKKGIHDVLTAYRFKPEVLADMLDKYMQESKGMDAQTPKRKPKSPSLGM